MKKYKVIFLSYSDEEIPYTEQYFDSYEKASAWVYGYESYEYEEVWNSASQEYEQQKIFNYYNPQDKQIYTDFEIKEIPSKLNETFLRMQKLAGLINEEEYNSKIWYDTYSKNISDSLNDLKQSLKDEGYNID